MLRHKAFRYRIYPNKEQEVLISKTFGCSRFVFNYFLNAWNDAYEKSGKGLSYQKCSHLLTQLKKKDDFSWLKEVDSISLQASLENLGNAFDRFLKKQNKYPHFKRKQNARQSYTTKMTGNNIQVADTKVRLPKLGWITMVKSRPIEGRILRATISRCPSGKYYVSILCETDILPLPKTDNVIGIDLGITDFAVLSNGQKIDNHRFTKKGEQRLKREQRKLSRRARLAKDRGVALSKAKNYQKQKIKVARLHERVKNQREDFLNKFSTELIKNHDVICLENLNTKGLLRNHKLAKSIADVSWALFVDKLQYKARWYDRQVPQVSQWFPSSQTCSHCGHIDGKKPLSVRKWTCPICNTTHDRDINAAINILHEGLKAV